MGSLRDILVKIKHRSKLLTLLWYVSRIPKFKISEAKTQAMVKKRANGYVDDNYMSMKSYEGIHKGQRSFIIATGPSLTIKDIELLKDEFTFGMNSIIKLFNQTDWRPTYFGIQDCNVYEKLEQSICETYKNANNVFISDEIAKKFKVPDNFHQFPYDAVYHNNQLEIERYFAKFSNDCYSIVYDGYSITYSLIQIAIYMGFSEIYLLGVDCSYTRGAKNHIVESGNDDKNEEKNHELARSIHHAAEHAAGDGVCGGRCRCAESRHEVLQV